MISSLQRPSMLAVAEEMIVRRSRSTSGTVVAMTISCPRTGKKWASKDSEEGFVRGSAVIKRGFPMVTILCPHCRGEARKHLLPLSTYRELYRLMFS